MGAKYFFISIFARNKSKAINFEIMNLIMNSDNNLKINNFLKINKI